MSAEPRHGPVTMHRAVERTMLKAFRARAADAPRAAPAPESELEPPADAGRPGAAPREAPPAGSRGSRPRLRRKAARGNGGPS